VLPLAVAIFRMTSPVANLAVAFFVAAIYGIEPGVMQIVAAVLVAAAVSVGTVGLPGQASFFTSIAPICIALGVPLDILPILLAVEVIPDIFRTVGNVTADMAATVIAARDKPVSVEAA
jgi:Na+/H+-dicarboxylate symporter